MNDVPVVDVMKQAREFEFSDMHFRHVQKFMLKETGIFLSERKVSMVYGRLVRRLRRIGVDTFKEYFDIVNRKADEREAFINALTTNKTQFFREKHHFDYLRNDLLPEWKKEHKSNIRIWSAGCSTGEEAYSIASILEGASFVPPIYDTKILATDLDTDVLEVARQGIYPLEGYRSIPQDLLKNGFIRGKGLNKPFLKTKTVLNNLISFRAINLMAPWEFKDDFDVIFCRNVMIYFEKKMQQELIERFRGKLRKGGILCIGHSENISGMDHGFEYLGNTMFRKKN